MFVYVEINYPNSNSSLGSNESSPNITMLGEESCEYETPVCIILYFIGTNIYLYKLEIRLCKFVNKFIR